MAGVPNPRFIIIERREKVIVMLAKGLNESEISKKLNVGQSTVCRDIKVIKRQSKDMIQRITSDILPYELEKCRVNIEKIIQEGWTIFEDKNGQWTNKDKMNALKLIKEAVRTKLEVLLQGPVTLHLQDLQVKVSELNRKIDEDDENVPTDLLLHDPKTHGF